MAPFHARDEASRRGVGRRGGDGRRLTYEDSLSRLHRENFVEVYSRACVEAPETQERIQYRIIDHFVGVSTVDTTS